MHTALWIPCQIFPDPLLKKTGSAPGVSSSSLRQTCRQRKRQTEFSTQPSHRTNLGRRHAQNTSRYHTAILKHLELLKTARRYGL